MVEEGCEGKIEIQEIEIDDDIKMEVVKGFEERKVEPWKEPLVVEGR